MVFSSGLPTSSAHLSPGWWQDFSVRSSPLSPAASAPSWLSPPSRGYSRNSGAMAAWIRRRTSLASFCPETRKPLQQRELTAQSILIFLLGACVFAGILRFSARFSSLRQRPDARGAGAGITPRPDQSIRRPDREDGGSFPVGDGLLRHRHF